MEHVIDLSVARIVGPQSIIRLLLAAALLAGSASPLAGQNVNPHEPQKNSVPELRGRIPFCSLVSEDPKRIRSVESSHSCKSTGLLSPVLRCPAPALVRWVSPLSRTISSRREQSPGLARSPPA